jgi:phosphate transport system protein
METHRRQFDKELDELRRTLIHMAAIAETMIDRAIEALVKRDLSLADGIEQHEEQLNRMQIELDESVQALIASHQPVAIDLRQLLAATKINSELERIGDLVMNIVGHAETLLEQPELKPLIDIPRMAALARKMVHDALHAFVRGDTLEAQSVILADDDVDALKDQIMRELLTYMISEPRTIERALALILVSRNLERIADHATNISEDVIYVIQGRDVRHPRTPRDAQQT